MPKMKTLSSAKKRFKVSASGKVRSKKAFARHMMMNKPKSMKRKTRGMTVLHPSDAAKVLKSWMPYAKRKKSTKSKTQADKGGA